MATFGKIEITSNRLLLNPSYLDVVDYVEVEDEKYVLSITRNDYYFVNYYATEEYKQAVIRDYIDDKAIGDDQVSNKNAFFNLVDPVKVERWAEVFAKQANAGTQENENLDEMLDEAAERIEEEYFNLVEEEAPNFDVVLTGNLHIFSADDFIELWEEHNDRTI